MGYGVDLDKITDAAGVYIFGRCWGRQFEALYVGKAINIRSRVKTHLNNLRLMQHLRNARTGKRIILAGKLVTQRGQRRPKSLLLAERALIRQFLLDGHDLVNRQGTRLLRHELVSSGDHPKRFIKRLIYLERAKGE